MCRSTRLHKNRTTPENGKFLKAVDDYKKFRRDAAKAQVYRKIKPGVWVDMGFYDLVDGYQRHDGRRNVFKFLLKPVYDFEVGTEDFQDIVHDRQMYAMWFSWKSAFQPHNTIFKGRLIQDSIKHSIALCKA